MKKLMMISCAVLLSSLAYASGEVVTGHVMSSASNTGGDFIGDACRISTHGYYERLSSDGKMIKVELKEALKADSACPRVRDVSRLFDAYGLHLVSGKSLKHVASMNDYGTASEPAGCVPYAEGSNYFVHPQLPGSVYESFDSCKDAHYLHFKKG